MATYRISFTVVLDHENDEDIEVVQETMDDQGAEAIADGLRRNLYGNTLRDVHSVSVAEEDVD